MRYAYLCVEGQHDVAFLGRLLEHVHGASQIRTVAGLKEQEVYEFWHKFVDLKFPHEDLRPRARKGRRPRPTEGDFTARMPVPAFYHLGDWSIAIQSAGGKLEEIVSTVYDNFKNWDDVDRLSAFALVCDADDDLPCKNFENAKVMLNEYAPEFPILQSFAKLEKQGDIIQEDTIRTGFFVFPDNEHAGTLEHVLIQCAATSYNELLAAARDYIGRAEQSQALTWNDSKKLKATIGCVSNVLQPGSANQVSLQKDNWICAETLLLQPITRLNTFISHLLDLQTPQK